MDDDGSHDDLTALVLGLARNLSPEEVAVQLAALWRTIESHGDPGLAGVMARTVDTMLQLRDYPARLMKRGAKTMAEVVDRFQQGMDELVRRGELRVLRRQAARRFGEDWTVSNCCGEFWFFSGWGGAAGRHSRQLPLPHRWQHTRTRRPADPA